MKKLFFSLLLLTLFPAASFSRETAKSAYAAISTELSGDVNIKKLTQYAIEYNTYKTFELEAPAAGNYYLNFWMMPSRKADGGYTIYDVLVNDELANGKIIPVTGGWQNIGLSTGSVYLSKGTNTISVVGQIPEIPLVEFVRLSSSLSKALISSTKYDNYIATIKAESLVLSTETPEQEDNSLTATEAVNLRATTLPNPQGIGQHYLDVDVKYSFYTYLFLNKNDTLRVSSSQSGSNSHSIDLFLKEDEFPVSTSHSWTVAASSLNSPRTAELNVIIPVSGVYFLKLRNRANTSKPALVNLSIYRKPYKNLYGDMTMTYYNDVPACGEIYRCAIAANQYSDNFTSHIVTSDSNSVYNCDPFLWMMDSGSYQGKVVWALDDGWGSGEYSWGFNARLKGTNPSYIGGAVVTSRSSYNPEGKCDLYLGYKECTIADDFPNLHPDDAIKSGLADFEYENDLEILEGGLPWDDYNCISWTGGMTDHWDWPLDPVWSDYHIEGDSLGSFDNFYSSVRYPGCGIYTREGATAENSVIDLWGLIDNNGNVKVYTHASIRKEAGDGRPHGYAWESKCGPFERIFHPRHALKDNHPDGYGEVVEHYRRVGTGQVYSLAEAVAEGKAVLENVRYNEDEISIIEEAKSAMSLTDITTFNNLYVAWKEARRKFALSSNPRKYTQCDEYSALLDYCRKTDNSQYLVLEELEKGDSFVTMLVQDLTLDNETNKAILSRIKEQNVQLRSAGGANIVSSPYSNCMKYAKQLLARDAQTFTQQAVATANTEARTSSKIIVEENQLWIATTNGLVKFNKQAEQSVIYDQTNGGLPEGQIVCIVKDQEDNIWVSSAKGLGKFNGSSCYEYTGFSQFYKHMAIDKNNNKWVGYNFRIRKYDNVSWKSFINSGDAVSSSGAIFTDLTFDKNDELWFVGQRRGYGVLAKMEGDNVVYIKNDFTSETLCLAMDNENNKWLGSNGMGLIKYNGTDFTYYNTENSGLPDNIVYDIKKDSQGNLWLLSGKNLVKFDGTDFTVYPIPYADELNCLEFDTDGAIWMTSGTNILVKCINGTFRRIDLNETMVGIDAVLSDNSQDFNVNASCSTLTVNISLAKTSKALLTVMDLNGRQLASLVNEASHPAGDYQYTVHLESGAYLIKYVLNGNVNVRKIIVN